MNKIFGVVAIAATMAFAYASASAQTSPGFTYGQVPTAAQWNQYFASKQDVLGYAPLNSAGGTMSGRLITAAPGTMAGLNLTPGTTPANPVNGDVWVTSTGLFVRSNGITTGPLTGPSGESFAATAPLSVSFPSSVTTYALTYGSTLSVSGGSLGINLANTNTWSAPQTIAGLTVLGSFTAPGLVTNAALANSSTTVNGQTCTLGASCTITAAATNLVVGTTTISGGSSNGILFNNSGTLGNFTSANNGVLITSGAGVPSISSTLPSALFIPNPTLTGTVGGTNVIPYSVLANLSGLSLLGRSANSSGAMSAITGGANQFIGINSAGTSVAFQTMSGDASLTGGAITIANSAITYAKIQNVTSSRLVGNPTGSTAAPSEISIGATMAFTGSALQTMALTGDVTSATNSFATTLATVNANVGSFGSASTVPNFTVNAKGLVTAAGSSAVVAPAGTLSGTTLAPNVVNSSLTGVGSLSSGALTSGFTPVALTVGGSGQTSAQSARGPSGFNIDQMTTQGDANLTIAATTRTVATTTALTAPRTFTLPAASSLNAGQTLSIIDQAGAINGTNVIVVQRAGTDTINGASSVSISTQYGGVTLTSDGVSKWSAQSGGSGGGGTGTVTQIDPGAGLVSSVTSGCLQTGITTSGTLYAAECVNAQSGTSYAIVDGDRGKLVTASNSGAQAYSIAQAGASSSFVSGWFVDVCNRSTNPLGIVTITPTTSTINGASSLPLGTGGQCVRVVSDGTNYQIAALTGVRFKKTQVITSTGTYTPSTGMITTDVECGGAGGGGGGATGSASFVFAGGGGGSGSPSFVTLTAAQVGASKSVTIGAAGAGASGATGGAGGDTCVGGASCTSNLCVGKGGAGGALGQAGGAGVGGDGGVSGTGSMTGTGAPGFPGEAKPHAVNTLYISGQGASSRWGGGGKAVIGSSDASGNAATGYGAGGGGAIKVNATGSAIGGNGTPGYAIFNELVAIN